MRARKNSFAAGNVLFYSGLTQKSVLIRYIVKLAVQAA